MITPIPTQPWSYSHHELNDTIHGTALNNNDDDLTSINNSELDDRIQHIIEALQGLYEYKKLITTKSQSSVKENVLKR